MKKSSVGWIISIVVLAFLISHFWPPAEEVFQTALPHTAEDVRVLLEENGFLPDYLYLLRARVTRVEFDSYVADLGLTPHSPERKYDDASTWLDWRAQPIRGKSPEWWLPSLGLETTFVRQDGQNWTYAKYENGYLFLKSLNH